MCHYYYMAAQEKFLCVQEKKNVLSIFLNRIRILFKTYFMFIHVFSNNISIIYQPVNH